MKAKVGDVASLNCQIAEFPAGYVCTVVRARKRRGETYDLKMEGTHGEKWGKLRFVRPEQFDVILAAATEGE